MFPTSDWANLFDSNELLLSTTKYQAVKLVSNKVIKGIFAIRDPLNPSEGWRDVFQVHQKAAENHTDDNI